MHKSAFLFTATLLSVLSAAAGQDGAKLIGESGIQGGVVVHLGCGDGTVAAQLAAGPQYVVLGLASRSTWRHRRSRSSPTA